ncbi:hypothetical protein C8R44DRAFT_877171 [Mycena epipterygia]|nr:hypothetical protein C8R44DRAFT_877171 [Mycena epipterygia]
MPLAHNPNPSASEEPLDAGPSLAAHWVDVLGPASAYGRRAVPASALKDVQLGRSLRTAFRSLRPPAQTAPRATLLQETLRAGSLESMKKKDDAWICRPYSQTSCPRATLPRCAHEIPPRSPLRRGGGMHNPSTSATDLAASMGATRASCTQWDTVCGGKGRLIMRVRLCRVVAGRGRDAMQTWAATGVDTGGGGRTGAQRKKRGGADIEEDGYPRSKDRRGIDAAPAFADGLCAGYVLGPGGVSAA